MKASIKVLGPRGGDSEEAVLLVRGTGVDFLRGCPQSQSRGQFPWPHQESTPFTRSSLTAWGSLLNRKDPVL